ncbi:MAG TPA: Ku protein [Ramlibacter sp.]|uniref:non-homologous end joining protein Ku n=1 Tax=Ramlibacter sp. TaxID=1917967 RepID=UPI002C84A380|nr:Ku protein [Ramlibacter sp.]HVZ45975.1 Ku protein [Ramlibacter sp.]
MADKTRKTRRTRTPAKASRADGAEMPRTSTRALWKGAITFGLVLIPVGLYSATAESDVNFDWLDRRTMDPVGYKRVNKRTGREIDRDDIVKGVEVTKGEYVVLSPDEIAEAYPRTTQTIEIETFIDLAELPVLYLEKPYYTAPIDRGDKVYALLREALRQTGKAGIGRVVIAAKQHLAVVMPYGDVLVVNLLRWGGEVRSPADLNLPGAKAGVKEAELKMAKQLIDSMAGHWDAGQFRDEFHNAIMKLVDAKAKAGKAEAVEPLEEAPQSGTTNVVDLTELLKRSLAHGGKSARGAADKATADKATAGKATASKTTAGKASARRTAARRKPASRRRSAA